MSDATREAAKAIARSHDARESFNETTARLSIASLDEAYDVQESYVARLVPRHGDPVGYKIGLTSKAMQEMCGVDTPVAGVVLRDRVHPDASRLSVGDYVHPGIEFEIAVRLGKELLPHAAPFDLGAVAHAVDGVAPAFEIIDDRNADYSRLDPHILVADNSLNAGIVVADFVAEWPDLGAVQGVIERDGVVVGRGVGSDVLGHPLNPLVWLANHLAGRGNALRAGEIVLTGSMARTQFVNAGELYRFTIGGIGSVTAIFDR